MLSSTTRMGCADIAKDFVVVACSRTGQRSESWAWRRRAASATVKSSTWRNSFIWFPLVGLEFLQRPLGALSNVHVDVRVLRQRVQLRGGVLVMQLDQNVDEGNLNKRRILQWKRVDEGRANGRVFGEILQRIDGREAD